MREIRTSGSVGAVGGNPRGDPTVRGAGAGGRLLGPHLPDQVRGFVPAIYYTSVWLKAQAFLRGTCMSSPCPRHGSHEHRFPRSHPLAL